MALDVKRVDSEGTTPSLPKEESTVSIAQQEQLLKQQKEIEEMKKMIADLAKAKSAPVASEPSQTADLVTTIISEMKKRTDAEKYSEVGGGYISEDELDVDDVLEQGVNFYCHSGGFVIVDDKRNGHRVPTPFRNTIVFSHLSTTRSGEGKNIKNETISMYSSNSKKEVEWLKNSSFYGKQIFNDFQIAKSSNARLASAIGRIMQSVRGMDKTSFFNACKHEGIGMSKNIDSMRLEYAQIMAEREVKGQEEQALFRAKNAILEKQLLSS